MASPSASIASWPPREAAQSQSAAAAAAIGLERAAHATRTSTSPSSSCLDDVADPLNTSAARAPEAALFSGRCDFHKSRTPSPAGRLVGWPSGRPAAGRAAKKRHDKWIAGGAECPARNPAQIVQESATATTTSTTATTATLSAPARCEDRVGRSTSGARRVCVCVSAD